jgi:RNA polymerase sigma factor (sigma-70 family)
VKGVKGLPAVGDIASQRSTDDTAEARRVATVGLIDSHDAVFRRTARRYSICADDAEDAYQRALEILLTKAPPIETEALIRWMQTVTKREALAVRRQRERLLSGSRARGEDEERDPLDSIPSESPEPTDRAASRERVTRSGEALRALKPQELRALTLKAEGYSYTEIGEITGWTYTKINRCMAEGRKRFLQVFADIEQGRRCEELASALSAVADGEGDAADAKEIESHLKGCVACRAKLRAFREIPDRVLQLLPVGPAFDHSVGGRPHEWIADRAGALMEKARELGYSALSRGGGEGATQIASAGGTRGAGMAALAKVLAVCGATAAGGATCVATGVVDPGAVGIGSGRDQAALERPSQLTQPADQADAAPVLPAEAPPAIEQPADETPLTPAQTKSRQFSFEESAPAPTVAGGSGAEFGGPGGGGGSGGGGNGGGGFGFEK